MWRKEKPGAREILWEKYLELRALHGENDKQIEVDLQSWYSSLPKSNPAKKWSRYKRVDRTAHGEIAISRGLAGAGRAMTC